MALSPWLPSGIQGRAPRVLSPQECQAQILPQDTFTCPTAVHGPPLSHWHWHNPLAPVKTDFRLNAARFGDIPTSEQIFASALTLSTPAWGCPTALCRGLPLQRQPRSHSPGPTDTICRAKQGDGDQTPRGCGSRIIPLLWWGSGPALANEYSWQKLAASLPRCQGIWSAAEPTWCGHTCPGQHCYGYQQATPSPGGLDGPKHHGHSLLLFTQPLGGQCKPAS